MAKNTKTISKRFLGVIFMILPEIIMWSIVLIASIFISMPAEVFAVTFGITMVSEIIWLAIICFIIDIERIKAWAKR